jgi:hypothetical protein
MKLLRVVTFRIFKWLVLELHLEYQVNSKIQNQNFWTKPHKSPKPGTAESTQTWLQPTSTLLLPNQPKPSCLLLSPSDQLCYCDARDCQSSCPRSIPSLLPVLIIFPTFWSLDNCQRPGTFLHIFISSISPILFSYCLAYFRGNHSSS